MKQKNRSNKFRVAVRAFEPFENALDILWRSFCRETGCELELEAVSMGLVELHSEILNKEGLKNGEWDIAHLNTDWVAEAHASGALMDLGDSIDRHPPENFPEGWSDSLLKLQKFGNRIVGLPFHDGPECLIYRTDLFDDPREQKHFYKRYGKSLKPPETWDEFLQVARFFQRPDENLYGSVFAAFPDGHNTVFDFCLQLWGRGGELLDESGKVAIYTEEAVEGLEFYRQLLRDKSVVHPGSTDFDSVKSGLAFVEGEVAMMVNWFGFASLCEVHENSKVKGHVNVANVPCTSSGDHVSLNVYWLYVIGSGSSHKSAAYDFIRFAVNAENDKLLTLEGGIGCRLSTWYDKEVNSIVPYYKQMEVLHSKARSLPRREEWSQIAAFIDKAVLDVLNTVEPVSEILKKWQPEIDQLQEKRN